jgi:hypothetical protein
MIRHLNYYNYIITDSVSSLVLSPRKCAAANPLRSQQKVGMRFMFEEVGHARLGTLWLWQSGRDAIKS